MSVRGGDKLTICHCHGDSDKIALSVCRIADSARRHSVTDRDIEHAVRNAFRSFPGDDVELRPKYLR